MRASADTSLGHAALIVLKMPLAGRSKQPMKPSLAAILRASACALLLVGGPTTGMAQDAGPASGGPGGSDGAASARSGGPEGGLSEAPGASDGDPNSGTRSGRRPLFSLPGFGAAEESSDAEPPTAVDVPQRPDAQFGTAPEPQLPEVQVPGISSYAPPQAEGPLATQDLGEITLAAQLTEEAAEIPRGLVWRVFSQQAQDDGKLPLVASAQGGTSVFQLEPGSYLVHAAYGRAGATKRITVTREPKREKLVLEAGGMQLDAVLSGGVRIPSSELRFSIFDNNPDANGDRALIIPDVSAGTVVRLNAGTYHVVSTYGSVNAVIRADIRVESGQLTEAIVEHKAAQLTMKLVREAGGEAIADTSWSVLTAGGDLVQENVGAFASMVLAEGDYTVIARNRDRIHTRDFTVVAGRNQDVEVLAAEGVPASVTESSGDE